MLFEKNKCLYLRNENELLEIQAWGNNSFRVRSTKYPQFTKNPKALTVQTNHVPTNISIKGNTATITNGKITAQINSFNNLSFYNQNHQLLLKGYQRNRITRMTKEIDNIKTNHFNSALKIDSREFKANIGGDYELKIRFEPNKKEKLFGMGQYQQDFLDLKNSKLELAHRNSQSSIPFVLSNQGYGFLWNNPAIGDVSFAKNFTEWHALSTKEMDFWITCEDTPSNIEEQYASVTGKVPMMPDFAMGYWQSKLRYRTQAEVLNVTKEFKKRNLPINVIVIDYFHWKKSGEFAFDHSYWPNPKKMIDQLHKMGVKVMVSVWPTIDRKSSHFQEMKEKGYLVQTERGIPITNNFMGENSFVDFTNPHSRDYVWNLLKKNYYDYGVDLFWLDEAEPEYSVYNFDNYRYYQGSNLQIGNYYPVSYLKMIFDGKSHTTEKKYPITLIRCAWAGSQKFGALVWSGDIDSSFQSLRNQLAAGLNTSIAGIPWWTTDIGGFHGGNNNDPKFQELLIRWFQFATFCPVMRMHGNREPHTEPLSNEGGGKLPSGAPTEPWIYKNNIYKIMKKYLSIRENLRTYIRTQMMKAHKYGTPVIRPLFYDFPSDKKSWNIEDQFMFGDLIMVAPILYPQSEKTNRNVYLPKSSDWINVNNHKTFNGGQEIEVDSQLESIPVFIKSQEFASFQNIFANFSE